MSHHLPPGVYEALALLYSDGTAGLLRPGEKMDQAIRDREFVDSNEHRPEEHTRIARVRFRIIEIIDVPEPSSKT